MTIRTCIVLALLLAPAAAQDKGATPDLRKQVETLKAEIAKRDAEIAKLRKAAVDRAVDRATAAKAQADATRRIQARINLAPAVRPVQLQIAPAGVRRVFIERATQAPANPLLTGDYKKALDTLNARRAALQKIEDPAEARKVVDEMERILLDARRALWQQEKAAGKKTSGDAGK